LVREVEKDENKRFRISGLKVVYRALE
jgi:hypothetical protein